MNPIKTHRVAATAAAVPILLSLALGAAGSAQSPSAAQPDASISGTVTFWNGYAADGAEITTFTDQVLPAFQTQYPNITVNHQEIPYDDLRQKLVTGIAGGTLPDVLRSDITWVPEFADQGVLLPLDQEMSDFADIAARVFPGPLSTNKWGDHYYGLPLDTNTRVLFANKDVLSQAGIRALPTTIDEFETMLKTVKDKLGPDVYGYAEGGTGAWSILPWVWSMGGGITTDDLSTAQGVLNGPGTVAAVTKLKEWLDAGYLSPSILGGGTATSDQFGNGQTATIVEGPWMPGIFANQFPDLTFEYAPIPAGPGGSTSVVGGEDIVVFNDTQNKDAALAFTRFMLSEDAQRMMGTTGQMPVLSSLTNDPALPSFFSTFQQQLATAKARTPVPSWPGIDEAISNGVLAALRGDTPVQDALDAAATTVDGLLQK